MRLHCHDGQRHPGPGGCFQAWRTIGLILCLLGANAGSALAVTGNLEPPPGEATNLNTGEPRATTPTQPSWAQTFQGTSGIHRFQLVMGGEAVLDRSTGLVWERSPGATFETFEGGIAEPPFSFGVARRSCLNLKKGGQFGWRLPSVHELASLVDPNINSGLTLPPGHPFRDIQSELYWSASVESLSLTRAWAVNFRSGFFNGGRVAPIGVEFLHLVLCVRGGGPLSQY